MQIALSCDRASAVGTAPTRASLSYVASREHRRIGDIA